MNLLDLLDELGISYKQHGEHHHTTMGWINIDCPFCGKDVESYRMGINIDHGYGSCWSCGGHNLVKVLSEASDKSFKRISTLLKDTELSPRKLREEDTKRGELTLPKELGELKEVHLEYLRSRRFNPKKLIKLWNIQGIGMAKDLAWRIFIPIQLRAATVSWTTRSVSNQVTRYLSAKAEQEIYNHKTLLYGEDYARHSVIVVEGPFDVWRVGPGAAATFGTMFTMQQVARISKYPLRVICYDNEPTAQAKARELCSLLEIMPGRTINVKLTSKDPDTAKAKDILKLRKLGGLD